MKKARVRQLTYIYRKLTYNLPEIDIHRSVVFFFEKFLFSRVVNVKCPDQGETKQIMTDPHGSGHLTYIIGRLTYVGNNRE